ncbi:hypothetical protein AB0H73_00115 [Streptomyces olivoreticuli]
MSIGAKFARRAAAVLLLGAASLSLAATAGNNGSESLRADSTWGVAGPATPATPVTEQTHPAAPMDSTWG